jgi:Iron-containing redox enzyme
MRDLTLEQAPAPGANPLPGPRGPLSDQMLGLLTGRGVDDHVAPAPADPLGEDDLHLALTLAYELSYRGLPGVPDELEWDPALLRARRALEDAFEDGLRREIAIGRVDPADVEDRLREIAAPPGDDSLSTFIEREATLDQVREFVVHRSAYQLKEADPHSWVLPRLLGSAKTTVMDIQYDEYGSGDPAWMHSELFRQTMIAVGLDGSYGAYLDRLPGRTLATANLITLFGLQRRWRGALVGHLAAFEMTSSLPNRAYGQGLRRLGFDEAATRFFDEHVEADSVHEVLACDLAVLVAEQEPQLAGDVIFGAAAMALVEDRFSSVLLDAWRTGRSSLLPTAAA